MRRYYLFLLQDSIYQTYYQKEILIYRTCELFYKAKKTEHKKFIHLFHQLCQPFDIQRLNHYLENKVMIDNYGNTHQYINERVNEKTMFTIRYSCVVIQSNKNLSSVFKIFNYYSKHIFVCDFDNGDYFFLSKQYHKSRYFEYH